MPYSALSIAKYITNKCIEDTVPISNLQLQKILYYIQYDFLQRNAELFSENFEAWKFGPVVPIVYSKFCGFGGRPIDIQLVNNIEIPLEIKRIIDSIVINKRSISPWKLVQETHKPACAWALTYNNGKGVYNEISKSLIKQKGF